VTEKQVLEKNNRINLLYDFYEPLLTNKQQTIMRYYYQENYSLGEISALFSITRQAVYEHIKRGEDVLELYEKKLQLYEKFKQRYECMQQLTARIETDQATLPEDFVQFLKHFRVQMDSFG